MPESRYIRQETLPQIGTAGQAALAQARIAIAGMGALGSASASVLARSGVGYLRLIDRDEVELSNLQRCALYTEADAAAATPKALAAAAHLEAINSTITLEPQVANLSGSNVLDLLAEVDLILDGSDNLELRFLINEAACKLAVPWIYTGVLGMLGMVMPILPGGPCLRCLSPDMPAPGSYPTCVTNGILATTTKIAASLQATLAIKHLTGTHGVSVPGRTDMASDVATPHTHTPGGAQPRASQLYQLDVWKPGLETITIEKDPDCPLCSLHQYLLL
jgi:adenylyltransferase/sulfurtransferase